MLTLTLLVVGCDSRSEQRGGTTSAATAGSAGLVPTGSGTASGSSGATSSATAPADPPFAGTWRASFEAKQGEVRVPEGVPSSTWTKDTGEQLTGSGSLEVQIRPDGDVSGTGSGALGRLLIRGRVVDDVLRAGLTPAEPGTPTAMSGVLVARAEEDSFAGQLRVSSYDGSVVRVAAVRFEKRRGAPPETE